MRYLLGISVLVWFNLHLSQGVLEHNPWVNQAERIGDGYPGHGAPQDAICTYETWNEIVQCGKDLSTLADNGFPWALAEMTDHIQYQQNQSRNLGDPLDPINYMCEVFGDFLKCVDQHAIPRECMVASTQDGFRFHTTFQFICHIQPRSTDLLASLQCLKESRVLDLLVLYLADRSGTHMDDMAQGNWNALFTLFMNGDILFTKFYIDPFAMAGVVDDGLICLPESVISYDVNFLVDRKCGSHAADLVHDYYLYYRTRIKGVLSKVGLPTNICDKETRRKPSVGRLYATPDNNPDDGILSRSFEQFVAKNSPGTAMDTPYGHMVLAALASVPDRRFCDPLEGVAVAFTACLLLSYDPSGKARFNILSFAHTLSWVPFTPYPDSSSLEIFRSCWNLAQQICGQNTSYFGYLYHVSAGSREIQRMMDNATCEWQDTLIRLYIKASEQGNIWPTSVNANHRPMYISEGRYTYGNLTHSMSDLISVVTHGVKEISARCSTASAKRMGLFYNRLKYFWYVEIKYYEMLQDEVYSSQISSPIW